MKIQFSPSFQTLAQYARFVATVELSHSFSSFLKQLRVNWNVNPESIEISFVPPSLDDARAEIMSLLEKMSDQTATDPDLSASFTDLADRAAGADDTEALLALLPLVERLGGQAAGRRINFATAS